jgi:hypothetical protein
MKNVDAPRLLDNRFLETETGETPIGAPEPNPLAILAQETL